MTVLLAFLRRDALVEASYRTNLALGLVQGLNSWPSSEHSKLAPASPDENAKLAPLLVEGSAGAPSIVVCGAVLSTVTVTAVAGPEVLPTASVAFAV